MKFSGMEKYVRTKSSAWLCFINLVKALLTIGVFVYLNAHGAVSSRGIYYSLGMTTLMLSVFFVINWIVLQVFRSSGRGGWLFRIANIIGFLGMAALAIVWLVTIVQMFGKTNEINAKFNEITKQFDTMQGLAMDTTQLIITGVVVLAFLVISALYFLGIYNTFRHIRHEIKSKEMQRLSSGYSFPKVATIMAIISGIELAFTVATFVKPEMINYALPNDIFSGQAALVQPILNLNDVGGIFILSMSVLVFLEYICVACCAKKFEEVHA